ncbi:MAG TPA: ribose-phosphate diphosphokinase, partial [Candidatus Marinimicrobia bacterium]|nr:ribose-phosphate diphosphokinase [Candidatus Neomarinimicrobiota bacterium]
IDTAGTLVNAAEAAIKNGAKSVTAVATHPLLSGPAVERLEQSPIKNLIVTDTVAISENKKIKKMKIVTVAEIFAEAIYRIHEGESVSSLFEF